MLLRKYLAFDRRPYRHVFCQFFSGQIRPSLAVPDRVMSSNEGLEPKQKGRLWGRHVYPQKSYDVLRQSCQFFCTYFGGRMSFPSMAFSPANLNKNRKKMQKKHQKQDTGPPCFTIFQVQELWLIHKFKCMLNVEITIIPKCYILEHVGSVSWKFQQTFPLSTKKTTQNLRQKKSSLARSADMATWRMKG